MCNRCGGRSCIVFWGVPPPPPLSDQSHRHTKTDAASVPQPVPVYATLLSKVLLTGLVQLDASGQDRALDCGRQW
jgi:hypothetical protein